jgi:hypothetical protein
MDSIDPNSKKQTAKEQTADTAKAAALFGRLRELRTRAQSLRNLAVTLQQQSTSFSDSRVLDREVAALLQENLRPFALNHERILLLIGEMQALLSEEEELYSAWGDIVGRIQVAWEKAEGDWLKVMALEGKDCSRQVSRIVTNLGSIIYDCGVITIPERITQHLELLPIGGALNFSEGYADELSTSKERQQFLSYLNLYPGFVDGLIDVKNEQIFRAAPTSRRRALTIFITAGLALAGFILVILACYLGDVANLPGWPFKLESLREHLLGYTFLLFGALAHVVITLLKQDRGASESPQALATWLLRIHVKENSFIISAISLWLGPFAMAFLFKEGVDWKSAFFVGYSYDSFIDLFLQRFSTTAASASDTIKKSLRQTSPQSGEAGSIAST